MKRIALYVTIALCIIAVCGLYITGFAAADQPDQLVKNVKAAYLTDATGQVVMYERNADDRYPIASMVKIMTALLAFEAIDRGEMTLDETVVISPEAMGMGGSQMFLNAGDSYPIGDLLKGVIVVSANDACVALAERLAGSEGAFVAAMNERAAQLGMSNTHFANCTGLPHPEGYSCAKDVSIMLRQLVRFPQYRQYSHIWLEDYTHPDGRVTTLTNTNKLVRFYDGCDGGKTGYTHEAGFCLAAAATKRDMSLISVVIGCNDSKVRFANSTALLNYGFANYRFAPVAAAGEAVTQAKVKGGKQRTVDATVARSLGTVQKAGATTDATVIFEYDNAKAPLCAGDKVGTAYLVVDGVATDSCDLVCMQDVAKGTWGDAIQEFLDHYHL